MCDVCRGFPIVERYYGCLTVTCEGELHTNSTVSQVHHNANGQILRLMGCWKSFEPMCLDLKIRLEIETGHLNE